MVKLPDPLGGATYVNQCVNHRVLRDFLNTLWLQQPAICDKIRKTVNPIEQVLIADVKIVLSKVVVTFYFFCK